MKKTWTIFLQAIIVLIGIGAFVFMLWQPRVEGRNVNATNFEIYFKDPFLAFAYVATIPFFVGLHRAFTALGYVRQGAAFSPATAKALRTIRYCALISIGFIVTGAIILLTGESDDRPPIISIGTLMTLVAIGVAMVAAKLERIARLGTRTADESPLLP